MTYSHVVIVYKSSVICVHPCTVAPSAAPVDLIVVTMSSTSLTLRWALPPEENRNGIISGYSINVTSNATGDMTILSTTANTFSVTSLSPYTTYLCSVAALTSVGLGPYTIPLTVRTDEEGNNF